MMLSHLFLFAISLCLLCFSTSAAPSQRVLLSSDSESSASSASSVSGTDSDDALDPVQITVMLDLDATSTFDLTVQGTINPGTTVPELIREALISSMTVSDVQIDIDRTTSDTSPSASAEDSLTDTPINLNVRVLMTQGATFDSENVASVANVGYTLAYDAGSLGQIGTLNLQVNNLNDPDAITVNENEFLVTNVGATDVYDREADGAYDFSDELSVNNQMDVGYVVNENGQQIGGNGMNNDQSLSLDVSRSQPTIRRRRLQDAIDIEFDVQLDATTEEQDDMILLLGDGGAITANTFAEALVDAMAISNVNVNFNGNTFNIDNDRVIALRVILNIRANSAADVESQASVPADGIQARSIARAGAFAEVQVEFNINDITDPDDRDVNIITNEVSLSTTLGTFVTEIGAADSLAAEAAAAANAQAANSLPDNSGAAPFIASAKQNLLGVQQDPEAQERKEKFKEIVAHEKARFAEKESKGSRKVVLSEMLKYNLYAMAAVIIVSMCMCATVMYGVRKRKMENRVQFMQDPVADKV